LCKHNRKKQHARHLLSLPKLC